MFPAIAFLLTWLLLGPNTANWVALIILIVQGL